MLIILAQSLSDGGGLTLDVYKSLIMVDGVGKIFIDSILVSALSAIITTILAFLISYTINYTNLSKRLKKLISTLVMIPMLLPTITYGFAIIYTYGRQGLATQIFGRRIIDVYSMQGLIFGFVIYILPISFMLINNAMKYIDKKYITVSRLLGDNKSKMFLTTVLRPLTANLAISFIQSFTLSFTDYGILASIAGNIELISTYDIQKYGKYGNNECR